MQTQTLAEQAQFRGTEFFLASYVNLLDSSRAKLVPAAEVASVERDGVCVCSLGSNLGLEPKASDDDAPTNSILIEAIVVRYFTLMNSHLSKGRGT